MRLLTLHTGEHAVSLHPRLTVLTGLSAGVHAAIVDAIAGIGRSRLPDGASGDFEAHGVRFPLESRTLDALALPGSLDTVLRPTDLPGGALPVDELHRRLEEAKAVLAERHAEAGRVRGRVDEALTVQALAERRPGLLAEVEARRAELLRTEAMVAEVRSGTGDVDLTPDDVAAIEGAHEVVVAAEDRVARARMPNPMARRRLREAEQAELDVLGRYGLPSYSAYLLRTATMHVDLETARSLAQLEAERAEAEKALAKVREELARCDAGLADADQLLEEARAALVEAVAAEEVAEAAVDDLEARLRSAPAVAARVDAGDVEVYVLARLAGLRAGGCAGSVPMAVDDAFTAVPVGGRPQLLALLDRLAAVVQIVYLTDDDSVVSWARSLGGERAAVVAANGTSGPSTV